MDNFIKKVGDRVDGFEAAMMRLSDVVEAQIQAEAFQIKKIDNATTEQELITEWDNAAALLDEQLAQLDKVAAWIGNHNEGLMSDYLDR